MLISEAYREQNQKLHAMDSLYGTTSYRWVDRILKIAEEMGGYPSILDYGCGKGLLADLLSAYVINEYDPAIAGKEQKPEAADLVICTDVLEHIEPECLDHVLWHLNSLTKKRLFFSIALRPAQKNLPDGRNAHLIVRDSSWWLQKLSQHFHIVSFLEKKDHELSGEACPRTRIEVIETVSALTDAQRNENFDKNREKVSRRLKIPLPAHGRKAILVCYGPSLIDTWPAVWAAQEMGQDVITVSGAHQFLIERNIIPKIHIDCDPRERKTRQFGLPQRSIQYWLGSCVDPSYLDILQGYDMTLWHHNNGKDIEDHIWEIEPEAELILGGGSVGMIALSVLYTQGYRDFEIHGMDCSFRDSTHAGKHLAPAPERIEVNFNGRSFSTSGSFISYARQFDIEKNRYPDATIRLHGDGLLQHMQRSVT